MARRFLALGMLVVIGIALPERASAQVDDPIIDGITVDISEVMQFPDTRGMGAEDSRSAQNVARINFMREIPGSTNEWLVNDLRGQIYRVNPATQQLTEYLDVGDEFTDFIIGPGGLSTGLINITLHPEFATNRKFYTIHEEAAAGNPATPDFQAVDDAGNIENGQHGVVIEWTANDATLSTFTGTHREIMRIAQPQGNLHNLGDIGFNPLAQPGDADYGLMYIAGGDGGYDDSNKGSDQADKLNSIFGKLLRIDPAGNNSENGAYGIPTANPYAQDGNPNTLAEIFARGFRNLHRINWDLDTGTFLGTDIGQGAAEEVNFLESAGDYGWDRFEGTFNKGGGTISGGTDTSPYVWPAAQYDHGDGLAIAGGFVYRGTQIPELQGKFIYGDIVNGRVFYSDFDELVTAHEDGNYLTTADVYELFLTQDGEEVSIASLVSDALGGPLPNNRVDLRFGQTSDGEVYLTTKQDGRIRRLGSGLLGDFCLDDDVDGADFIKWQRGETPLGYSSAVLAAWERNFGALPAAVVAPAVVPEPTALLLCSGMLLLLLPQRIGSVGSESR